jgi:protein-disulfide isomerase
MNKVKPQFNQGVASGATRGSHNWLLALVLIIGLVVGFAAGNLGSKTGFGGRDGATVDSAIVSEFDNATTPEARLAAAKQLIREDFRVQVAGDREALGSPEAKLTLVEFSDFQCPFCRRYANLAFPDIKRNYIDTGKVKYVYRHFALDFHPGAIPAARASECAREQGKFWEAHKAIFDAQNRIEPSGQTVNFGEAEVKAWLKDVPGLDYGDFETCYNSGKYADLVKSDVAEGARFGVNGTPAVFVGDELISGAQPFQAFANAIEKNLR